MPLKDFVLIDKVPDNFEYSGFSQEPEITDNVGTDTLEWSIDLLDESEIIEISYDISGSGEYRPPPRCRADTPPDPSGLRRIPPLDDRVV